MLTLIYFHFSMLLIFSLPLVGETANSSYPPPEVGSIRARLYERVTIRAPNGKVQTIDIPLNHGQITVTPVRGDDEPKTVSADSDGYYRIVRLLPGNYRVTATVPGYGSKEKPAQVKKYKLTQLSMKVKKRV